MKKRILSLLLVVAMLAAMIVMPTYAAAPNAADYNNTPDTCPCCGEAWSAITWTDFNATCFTNAASSGAINSSGHYKLSGNVTGKSGCSYAVRAQSGGKVVLDLNGYTVTNNYGRPFRTQSSTTLYIVDRSSNSTGLSSGGTTTGDTFLIDAGTTVNIYAGTFTKPINVKNNGGVFLARGTLNIYGGIYDASAYNQTERSGGVIYVDSTGSNAKISIYDGHIIGGTSSLGGGAICAEYGTLTISGGYISGSVMSKVNPIVLSGSPTMTCLDLESTGAIATVNCDGLADGASIRVSAAKDAVITGTLTDAQTTAKYFSAGYAPITVNGDNALVVGEKVCPHCDKAWSEITWNDWTYGTGIKYGNTGAVDSGHYKLTADTAKSSVYYIGASSSDTVTLDVCLDLNGYDLGSTNNRLFYMYAKHKLAFINSGAEKATLSMKNNAGNYLGTGSTFKVYDCDMVNTTTSTSYSNNGGLFNAQSDATVFIKNSTMTGPGSSILRGGVAYLNTGANLTMENCVVNGGNVSQDGAVIYADGSAKITLNNCTVNDGTTTGTYAYSANGIVHNGWGATKINDGTVIESITFKNNACTPALSGTVKIGTLNLYSATSSSPVKINISGMNTNSEIGLTATTDKNGNWGAFTTALTDNDVAQAYINCFTNNAEGTVMKAENAQLVLAIPDPTYECPFCGSNEEWKEWDLAAGSTLSESGHYRLTGAKSIDKRYYIGTANAGVEVCLDMAGCSITSTSGTYNNFWVETGNTLRITDTTNGSSTVTAKTNNNGGAFYVKGTLEIDGVDISSVANSPGSGTSAQKGGLVYCSDTANVKIKNSTLTPSTNKTVGYGGAVAVNSATVEMTNCTINGGKVYGNGAAFDMVAGNLTLNNCTVTGGEAVEHGGAICVYDAGTLTINGGSVSNGTAVYGTGIYLGSGATFNISDTTTGEIGMYIHSELFQGYGKAILNTSCETLGATITLESHYNAPAYAQEGALYASAGTVTAKDGAFTWHDTAAEAVATYNAGNADYIVACGQNITLADDAVIDVNGNDVTISGEAEVTLFDSANVNYISYGDVTLDGVTLANEVEYTAPDGNRYIKLENAGVYSFHVLNLKVSAVGLKTVTNGMYYYANYECDDTLKTAIAQYGIGYSLYDTDGTSKIVEKTQAVAINSSELALVAFEDIPVGSMNGIIGSDINGYSDSECGQMKIGAQPFVVIDGQIVSGIEVKYSMYDCCDAVDKMITELLAANAEDTTAANYISYMENLFDVVWADCELGWNFTNFAKAAEQA